MIIFCRDTSSFIIGVQRKRTSTSITIFRTLTTTNALTSTITYCNVLNGKINGCVYKYNFRI